MNSRHNDNNHLGVNKIGKNIKKPILPNPVIRPDNNNHHQPQVYNINKNDFRNIVQQLTGSPSQETPCLTPPSSSKSLRLQRIRPPPLSPINVHRPRLLVQMPPQNGLIGRVPLNDNIPLRPAESPISAYMRYLQHSINDGQQQNQSPGLLPNPRMNGQPPILPSPTSQFLLPSPRSPYPLLSPGYQHPTPLSPIFPFSPMGLPGILGPGPGSQPPLSPGFFHVSSPKWRG